ncbi:MAG: hypothetical protein AVDCRST_MAG34-3084, partial [uncultured Nocardioidaceae bacterium]
GWPGARPGRRRRPRGRGARRGRCRRDRPDCSHGRRAAPVGPAHGGGGLPGRPLSPPRLRRKRVVIPRRFHGRRGSRLPGADDRAGPGAGSRRGSELQRRDRARPGHLRPCHGADPDRRGTPSRGGSRRCGVRRGQRAPPRGLRCRRCRGGAGRVPHHARRARLAPRVRARATGVRGGDGARCHHLLRVRRARPDLLGLRCPGGRGDRVPGAVRQWQRQRPVVRRDAQAHAGPPADRRGRNRGRSRPPGRLHPCLVALPAAGGLPAPAAVL